MIRRLLNRLKRRPTFAQGGKIGPPPQGASKPFLLSPPTVYMTRTQYNNLGPKTIAKLWPSHQIEIVFTPDEVREFGSRFLERINPCC